MAVTTIESSQIRAAAVQRSDLNTGTVGAAVVAKIIQGTNVSLSSTGADSGTGDVTISVPGGGIGPQGNPAYTNSTAGFTVPAVGSTVVVNVNNGAWATVGEVVWVAGAGVSGAAGAMQVTAAGPTSLTLQNITP